jgi:hypothetical protein
MNLRSPTTDTGFRLPHPVRRLSHLIDTGIQPGGTKISRASVVSAQAASISNSDG